MTEIILKRAWPPLVVTFLLLAFWVAVLAIPGALLIVLLFVLGLLGTQIGLLIGALLLAAALIVPFWWRHWISGLTMMAGLVLVILLASLPTFATSPAEWVAHLAQVVYYRPVLLQQAAELESKGLAPAVAGHGLDGFGSLTSGIALDPSGEILLPPDRRSQAWMATGGQTELAVRGMEAHHIIGNYYSWFHD